MTALYLERYLNWGLSREELQSGKPIIGIAQSGSDLAPCNRHHLELAKRVREGIREAGGIVLEFPVLPIQETGRRPTAMLDRNLAYLGLVETLFGYPLDGVVLTTGCDKTTPSQLMAAATVNIPAIALSVGPMLNGWYEGRRAGSGTIKWEARKLRAAGRIDDAEFVAMLSAAAPSPGFCNTMGTATTMNGLAEVLGMMLPGSAVIPAVHRDRGEAAYRTGRRIVEMVADDLRPSDIMTRAAFENAIVACSAMGGSTNAPIHLNAIAAHLGVPLDNDDWEAPRPRRPAARRSPAGGPLPRRGLLPRRRRARGHRGAARRRRAAAPRRAHGDGSDDRRGVRRASIARSRRHPTLGRADHGGRGVREPARQPVRHGDHEDERHLGRPSASATCPTRTTPTPSRVASRSSTAARTTTRASTTPTSASTSARCSSCAAPGRSATRARPRS